MRVRAAEGTLGQLVLTPKTTPTGPVYEVTGGFDLLAGNTNVMPMVARDGIERHYASPMVLHLNGIELNPAA